MSHTGPSEDYIARNRVAVRPVAISLHGVAGGGEELRVEGEQRPHGKVVTPLGIRGRTLANGGDDVLAGRRQYGDHVGRKTRTSPDHVGSADFVVGVRGERAVGNRRIGIKDIYVFEQCEIRGVDARDLHEGLRTKI